ncbi:glycosyltransferase family 2 protein [Chryseobacterium koreense]|uniref:glycosyltransferase family 2 protein n=1 Tax=Chryseobacterium koreense TaxID=232216 RepID=UPI0026F0D235|nr:glycosyltransferase family 2 protein [Chryseobacterium koreense]
MTNKLTIFTPTYNRAHLLPRLYKSLCEQTAMNFIWMIIDDGSTDGTAMIVEEWKREADFEIQYHYKENGGMHTAHNMAYAIIDTELNVCIDSDDQMPPGAVEKIINIWKANTNPQAAGIIGLDADLEGKVLGTPIPRDLKKGNLKDLYKKFGVTGDKKLVLRSELTKQYPAYPEYKKEKLVPLGILYLMIGNDYDFIYSNEVLCLVDYQEGGSSNTIQKQYFQSPRGFAYAKQVQKKYSHSAKEQITYSIHIGISSLITKDFSLMNQGPKIFLNWLFLPLAYLGFVYLKRKTK